MNTPVKLELAKLLKEKNIVVKSDKKYNHFLNKEGEEITDQFIYDFYNGHVPSTINIAKSIFAMSTIPAPTIVEVVMWSFNTHKIWITVDLNINGKFNYLLRQFNSKDRAWEVKNPSSIQEYFNNPDDAYSSPTEAYKVAIEYTLNELI